MLKNYLKIALRKLWKEKTYSAINIFGLAVGMTCCVLILVFIQDELQYDQHHEKKDRIYRVTREWFNADGASSLHLARVAPPVAPLMKIDFQDIEQIARLWGGTGIWLMQTDDQTFLEEVIYFAEPAVFDIFSMSLIRGNPAKALLDPNSLILSESKARQYFGDEDPIGKSILVDKQMPMKVTGVMKDIPRTSHFHFDLVSSFVTLNQFFDEQHFQNWGRNNYATYLLTRPGADWKKIDAALPAFMDKHMGLINGEPASKRTRLHLQPLTEIHLHSKLQSELGQNGDIFYVYIFAGIGFFLMIIACINFMNLSTARSANRAREIGLRKVVGAARTQLIRQFIGESMLFAALALMLTVIFVELAMPFFRSFVGKDIAVNYPGNLTVTLGLLIITVFVGLFSGSYPALFLSSFRTIDVLKGKLTGAGRTTRLRKALVVFQFSISIVLIVSVAVVFRQVEFFHTNKLGFDKERIVTFSLFPEMKEKWDVIRERVSQDPNVLHVTASKRIPSGRLLDSWTTRAEQKGVFKQIDFRMAAVPVDYEFFDTYGIKLVAGRSFSRLHATDDSAGYVLNQAAVRRLGWATDEAAVGKVYESGNKKGTVVGVVQDFHFESLHAEIPPISFMIGKNNYNVASVKIKPDGIPNVLQLLKSVWAEFYPEYPFSYTFVDQEFDTLYKSEEKLMSFFGLFSGLAILIACLGLLGLSAFTAQKRTKEIGIRKVLGASAAGLVGLLSAEFVKLVVVANVIAWPIAYLAMDHWLQGFAYRIDLNLTVFLLAGMGALLISFVTVSYQAVRTALANPVDSLRYE